MPVVGVSLAGSVASEAKSLGGDNSKVGVVGFQTAPFFL
jgi:hypothetical protein